MVTDHSATTFHPYPFVGVREVIGKIILSESQAVQIGQPTMGDITKRIVYIVIESEIIRSH